MRSFSIVETIFDVLAYNGKEVLIKIDNTKVYTLPKYGEKVEEGLLEDLFKFRGFKFTEKYIPQDKSSVDETGLYVYASLLGVAMFRIEEDSTYVIDENDNKSEPKYYEDFLKHGGWERVLKYKKVAIRADEETRKLIRTLKRKQRKGLVR